MADNSVNYTVSTDKTRFDLDTIYNFLTNSYWAKGRPSWLVKKSIDNSFCFGIFSDNKQVGFARIVTDYFTFAYLMDVFILEEFRGKGLSKILLKEIFNHPELQNISRWMLATRDAHGLYSMFGFEQIPDPDIYMIKSVDVNLNHIKEDYRLA